MSQGFGKGVVSLNVRYNRQILLSAIELDSKYHLALKAQKTRFKYHDLFIGKTCLMKTQAVQSGRVYHINSTRDLGIADQQIKNNKKYARINNVTETMGLYRLVVNYNHVTVDFFSSNQTKEVAGVIYGLSHMGQYLQNEFEKWHQEHYSENHGIHLSDDEMGMIVMLLRASFSNRRNSLSVRMDSETFRIGFVKMITNQAPLNLSKEEAKNLLELIKREGDYLFNRLKLSAVDLKLIYHDIIEDLNRFIYPVTIAGRMTDELNKSIQIANHQSIRRALDYIFRDDPNSISLIDDVAYDAIGDSLNDNKTFLIIDDVMALVKKMSTNAERPNKVLLQLNSLKQKGIKYIMSYFLKNGSIKITPVRKKNFDDLISRIRNDIKEKYTD